MALLEKLNVFHKETALCSGKMFCYFFKRLTAWSANAMHKLL